MKYMMFLIQICHHRKSQCSKPPNLHIEIFSCKRKNVIRLFGMGLSSFLYEILFISSCILSENCLAILPGCSNTRVARKHVLPVNTCCQETCVASKIAKSHYIFVTRIAQNRISGTIPIACTCPVYTTPPPSQLMSYSEILLKFIYLSGFNTFDIKRLFHGAMVFLPDQIHQQFC